jgi:DNA-binding IclR family transcriptional regulator
MTRPELPADVRRFILTSIPSVPYLEAVLLLRAEPATAWGVAELARRLYVPERTATELLQTLTASGIAARMGDTNSARYAPAPELRELLDELAQAYSKDLVAITDLIHSRIDRRAQRFADAFRFRKE